MTQLEAGRMVLASHNPGKLKELRDLIGPFGFRVLSAADLGLPEPEETGTSFEENAAIKAEAAAKASGLPALADDSGLAVDALGGDPGVYSARWAGPEKDFAQAMRNIEEKLRQLGVAQEDRTARFVSVIALARPGGETELFRGEVKGELVWPPRGKKGFGYDPMFRPEGHDVTFGEMEAAEKHGWRPGDGCALSHRARAFQTFARAVLGVE